MKISIIVVAYNEVNYIDQTLESIFAQKGVEDFEVIVGDDGSNDGTIDRINKWKQQHPDQIKVFVMDRPQNLTKVIASVRVSEVIKRGIDIASGDYLCLLAGDDFYCSDQYLYKQVKNLEKEGHEKCVASICGYEKYWDENERENQNDYFKHSDVLSSKVYLGGHMYMHLSAFMFRNIFKEKKETLADLHFVDDVGLTFVFGNYGNYCGIEEVLFSYRQRPKSIMAKNDPNDNRLCSMLLYSELYDHHLWKYPTAYRSRMLGAMSSLFENRKMLVDHKYDKYFELANSTKLFNANVFRGEVSASRKFGFAIKKFFYYCCYAPYRLIVKTKYH